MNIAESLCYWQVNFAAGKAFPRTVPLLLTLAGLAVAFTHVAVIVFAIWAEMFERLTSVGSDVDQVPLESAIIGQTPETLDDTEKVTWFAGGAAA